MSERTTAEIVADLREFITYCEPSNLLDPEHIGTADEVAALLTDIADRLTELDASNKEIIADCNRCLGELRAIKALRPTCPTCGGTLNVHPERSMFDFCDPCPDCVDGKVSIEQLVAIHKAVWDEWNWDENTRRLYMTDAGFRAAIHILRCVKP